MYTKTALEGDPYDEGYFIEYDHDINDVIADGSAVIQHTRSRPSQGAKARPGAVAGVAAAEGAPQLRPGCVAGVTQALLDVFGELETCT